MKCKNTIKFIVTLALAFFLIAAVTSNVKVTASTQPSTLEYYLQYQLSSDKVDDTQKESLQKIIEVRKITEQQVLDSLKKATAEFNSTRTRATTIPIGSDHTFTTASEGKSGGQKTGVGNYTTSYDLSNNRNLVGCWAFGAGQGAGWAWTGHRFNIGGVGSQTASFSVDGYYNALLEAFGQGANAIMDLRLRLYDATEEEWVDEDSVVFEVVLDDMATYVDEYSVNNLVQGSLQGGHQYVILLQFDGVATSLAGSLAEVESGRPNRTKYSDWSSIELDF